MIKEKPVGVGIKKRGGWARLTTLNHKYPRCWNGGHLSLTLLCPPTAPRLALNSYRPAAPAVVETSTPSSIRERSLLPRVRLRRRSGDARYRRNASCALRWGSARRHCRHSLRCFRNGRSHGRRNARPGGGLRLDLPTPSLGELVVLRAPAIFRLTPIRAEPALLFQTVQRRKQRAGLHVERAARDLRYAARDAESVVGSSDTARRINRSSVP